MSMSMSVSTTKNAKKGPESETNSEDLQELHGTESDSIMITSTTTAIGDNAAKKKVQLSHLDKDGRPFYLAENVKGTSGQNRWMWENAMLIFGSKEETRSANCIGAWCLRCEELGKTNRDCHLNYHPTRNFKAISRHFKRFHQDLNNGSCTLLNNTAEGDQDFERKRSVEDISLTSNRSPSSMRNYRDKRLRTAANGLGCSTSTERIPRSHLSLTQDVPQSDHRIICPPTFHSCREGRLVVVTEHMLSVPLYRSRAQPGYIDIFFSILERVNYTKAESFKALAPLSPSQRAEEYVNGADLITADGMMLFLQGGPGFGAPIANVNLGLEKHTSWAACALEQYSRVILMDQRGTGRSCRITKQSLECLFPDMFLLDPTMNAASKSLDDLRDSRPDDVSKVKEAVAGASDFLAQFRADSIVQDAEAIKAALLQWGSNPVSF